MKLLEKAVGICLAALLLVSCGGSNAPAGDPAVLTSAPLAQASEGSHLPADLAALRNERPMAAGIAIDAEILMDWAEIAYPQYFPSQQSNQTAAPYIYRYYPETRNYLGIDGDVVRVLGPSFGQSVLTVATMQQLACRVFPEACSAPVANAGAGQAVTTGTLVTLDGSASTASTGSALTYQWSFSSRPFGSLATIANPTDARPTVRPDVAGAYVITLLVSDGRSTASASVAVTATTAYVAPVANAGVAQNAFVGSVVSLSGAGSTVSSGRTLAYSWTMSGPLGNSIGLDSSVVVTPRFTPTTAGVYTARLLVNDGVTSSAAATTTVTVISVATTPVTPTSPTSSCCRVCSTGKACGDSCISRTLTCHKGSGCAC